MNLQNISVGTDIESIERFAQLEREKDAAFLSKIFTHGELDYCFTQQPAAKHLAARYAAKEAVIKALSSLGHSGVQLSEIEVSHHAKGHPLVVLKRENSPHTFTIKMSLSHCEDRALAFAIVEQMS